MKIGGRGSSEGEWREGRLWLLDALVHSATAWVAGGVECEAGTVTGFYSAVWALGIPFPMLLLWRGKRELGFSGVNTTYSSGREITAPGEKNSEDLRHFCFHSIPSSLYDFISKFYIGFHVFLFNFPPS